jgi:hypothetical protein
MPTQPQDGSDCRTQLVADRTVFVAERIYAAWSGPVSLRWPASAH